MFASTADETERDVVAVFQLKRGAEYSVERMTRAMVSGVHYDKPICQSVLAAKRFPALLRKTHRVVVGPRWNDCHPLR